MLFRSAGVSLGKYEAFLALQKLDPSITLEEVSGLCMCEIQDLIRDYEGQTDEYRNLQSEENTGAQENSGEACPVGQHHNHDPNRPHTHHHEGQ